MRIFIYARKSIKTDKGESINNQFETCKSYIHLHYGDAATDAEIFEYEDEGYSGKDTNRPHFQQMMRDMRQPTKKPDCIVVYRLDRISRSVADFAQLMDEMKSRNIEFISVSENIDTRTPFGEAMLLLVSVFAQMERASIAERVRDNMMLLARTGRWLGGPAPTGFDSEKTEDVYIDGKSKKSAKLKINSMEMKTVRLIFNKFLELKSLSGVQKYLMHNGYKSRKGIDYSRLVIKGILQNPVYCAADSDALDYFRLHKSDVCFDESLCNPKVGLIAYNKRDYKLKGSPRLSKDQWIISKGKHPAIITGKQWVAIQKVFDKNDSDNEANHKQRNDYSLLSGLIICKKCGSRMFAKPRTGSSHVDKTQFDYLCNMKMNGGTIMCNCQNLPGQITDDAICAELGKYTEQSSPLFEHLEKMRHNLIKQVPINPIIEIDKHIKKANDEINNIVSAIAKGVAPALLEKLNAQAKILEDEIGQLSSERRRCQNDVEKADNRELQLDLIVHSLATLKNRFDELSLVEKRTILRLLINKIEWDGEKLDIFPNGEQ